MSLDGAIAAYLPGRNNYVLICHTRPADCPTCLARIAAFLAAELRWDLQAALDKPAEAYAAELYPQRPTLDQARELRRLVAKVCYALGDEGARVWRELLLDNDFESLIAQPEPIVADFDFAVEAVAA